MNDLGSGGSDRAAGNAARAYRFGSAEVDERRRELRVRGEPVAIEAKPFDVLVQLLRRAGETLTKDELFDAVWPGRVVTEGVLAKCVMKLRAILGDDAIRTVHGFGYRIVAPVEVREAAPARAFEPRAGDTVLRRPNWKLVRALGEGGYALVWLAEHAKTRERRVFKYARDAASLGALKREVTIYRMLRRALGDEAPLVAILDWNVDEPPYHVESAYVAGGNLAEWHTANADAPRATRIELVAQVADALAAAHAVGVLHKDLKPANVLVDATVADQPRALLCDFGIGEVLDPERLAALGITRAGFTRGERDGDDTSGTPLYLAPEVVAGEAPTTRSDVHSLGVMLYQLVVGDLKRGLGAGWERDVADPLLRDDIAAAADVDPKRRLADAGEIARRLRALEPRRAALAQAEARAAMVRSAEAARRNRRVAFALAAVMTVAAGVSWAFYRGARGAQREAEREAATSQAINRFLNEDLLAAADPYLENLKDAPLADVIERALPRVEARLAGQPAVAGEVYRTLGNTLLNLGRVDAAQIALDHAVDTLSRVHGATARPTVAARVLRASVEEYAGRYDEYGRALESLRADLAAFDSRDARVIEVDRYLAWSRFVVGRFADSERAYAELLVRIDGHPDVGALDRAWIEGGRSLALARLGRGEEALAMARSSRATRLAELGPDHPDTLQSSLHEATALMALDRVGEALPIYAEIERRNAARLGPTHYETAIVAREHGVALLQAGRPVDAVSHLERAHAAIAAAHGDGALSAVNAGSALGLAYLRAGRAEDAEHVFAALAEPATDTDSGRRALASLDRNLGELRLAQGRVVEAHERCTAGETIARSGHDATHPLVVTLAACRGVALAALGRAREARDVLAPLSAPLLAAGTRAFGWDARAAAALIAAEKGTRTINAN